MKAAVFYDVGDIRLEDVPEPTIGDADVLIQVAACGICGSDLEYYHGRSPIGTADGKGPLILGHEISGTVVAVGKHAQGVAVGDRVAVNPIQSSAASDHTRSGNPHFDRREVLGITTNGGFAEFVRSRAEHAYLIPDELSDEQGAFVEMLAGSLNAVEKAEIQFGDLCVIYGPGSVGLSMAQLAYRSGARVAMVGTRDYRLELALKSGCEFAFNTADTSSRHYTGDLAESLRAINAGELAERCIVATAVDAACRQALEITGVGSTVVYMGVAGPEETVGIPMLRALTEDKSIRFSWLYPNQWPKTIRLLRAGMVDTSRLITHTGPLDRINAAIEQVSSRDDGVIKYVIKPGA